MAQRRSQALAALLAAAVPATALAAGADGWHGRTAQGFPVDAVVSRSGTLVDHLRTHYALDCSDGSVATRPLVLSRRNGDTVVIDEDGRFATSGTIASGLPGKGSGSVTYRVAGRVKPAKITGSLRVDYTLDSGVTCTTTPVSFVLR